MSTVPLTATFIGVDSSTLKTLTLPLSGSRQGRVLIIKDRTGFAASNAITLQAQGSDSFETGLSSYTINTSYGCISLIARGQVWFITASTLPTTSTTTLSAAQIFVSSIQGDGSRLTNLPAISSLSLYSTIAGLGSAGYVSSSQLLSTSQGLRNYMDAFIDPTELTSTVIGLGTGGFISTLGLTYSLASTVTGLGTLGYISTSQLLSTTVGVYQTIANTSGVVTTTNLTSTVVGLGTAGYKSSFISTFSVFAIGSISSATLSLSTLQFVDQSTGVLGPALYQSTNLLYFNGFPIGGSRVGAGQVLYPV